MVLEGKAVPFDERLNQMFLRAGFTRVGFVYSKRVTINCDGKEWEEDVFIYRTNKVIHVWYPQEGREEKLFKLPPTMHSKSGFKNYFKKYFSQE